MAPISVGIFLLLSIQFLSSSAIEPSADPVPELAHAYFNFYACILQCYRDSFGVNCAGDNPCTEEPHIGPFKKKQRFPFMQVENSFYCITKTCNSQVPKYLCDAIPMDNPSDQSGANIDNGSSSNTYNGNHANAGSHDNDNCDDDCVYYCDDGGNSNKGQKEDRRNSAASKSSGTANSRSNSQGAEAGAETYSSTGSYENSGGNPSSGGNPKSTIENNKYSSFMTLIKRMMLKSNSETTTTDTTTDCYSTETETTATDTTTDCYSTETETTATDTTTDCYSTETETTPTDTTTDCYSTETETTPTDTTTDCYSTETETTTTDSTTDCDDGTESTVASTFPKNEEGIVNYAPVSSSAWSSAQSNTGSISNGNPGYNNLHTPEANKNYNWNSQPNILRPYGDSTNYFMPYSSLAGNGNPNSWLPTTHYLNGWVPNAQQSLLPDQTKVLNSNNMYNKIPYNSNGVMSNTQSIEVPNTQNKQILPQKNMENTQQIFWPQNQLSYAQHPNIYHYPLGPIPASSQSYFQNPFSQSTPFVSASRDVTDNGQQSSIVHTAAISNAAYGSNTFNGDKSGSNTQPRLQQQIENRNAYYGDNSGINRYSWMHGDPSNPQQFFISKTQQDETRGVTNNGQPSSVAHSAAISDSVSGNVFYGDKSGDNTQRRLQQQIQNQNVYSGGNSGINRFSWMHEGPSNPQQFLISKTQQDETRDVTNNGQPSSVAHSAAISDSVSGNVFYGDKSGGNTQPKLPQQIQNQNAYSRDNSGINRYSWVHGGPPNPQQFFISKTQQDETVVHKNENVP